MTRLLSVIAAGSFAVAVSASAAPAPAADAAGALKALLDEAWEFQLRESPLFATFVGDHRFDDRLPSVGPADRERRRQYWDAALKRLQAIDRGRLTGEDRISYDMFQADVEDSLAELRFGEHRMPITSETGFHFWLVRLPDVSPPATVKDYENYVARLRATPQYFRQQIANMREGIRDGFTQPRVVLEGFETTIAPHAVDDPAKTVWYAPFATWPHAVPASERERLRREGEAAIREASSAFRELQEFITREYIPAARATTAARDLPNGRAYYEYLVRRHTTLALTPEEVHRIGLAEVDRIRKEMDDVMRQTGFKGDFAAFLQFLRTDPRFYPKTGEELLKEASRIAKRMDGKLPSLFRTLPRQPYGVEPVPADIAPRYTAGRYVPAPINGTRAGTYWVNTHALESRPLYNLEALTLHEAVPGHHLQNALRQELTGIPAFRRFGGVNAYGEGWGLYSEHLGLEAGFYKDPYSNFGRLTYEMWRACRLVVDTGMHALGWTRQQAIDYLASRTALSLHEVRTEIDRYVSWPGQALAYKMGELKIRELRREAEQSLGARFDLRGFHDVVMLSGPVPLTVLEEKVRAWVADSKQAPAGN